MQLLEVGSEHAWTKVERTIVVEHDDGTREERTEEYMAPLEGRRTTEMRIPDDADYNLETPDGLAWTANEIVLALKGHIQPGFTPDWIIGDHPPLVFAVLEQYGLKDAKYSEKPADWDLVVAPKEGAPA